MPRPRTALRPFLRRALAALRHDPLSTVVAVACTSALVLVFTRPVVPWGIGQ